LLKRLLSLKSRKLQLRKRISLSLKAKRSMLILLHQLTSESWRVNGVAVDWKISASF